MSQDFSPPPLLVGGAELRYISLKELTIHIIIPCSHTDRVFFIPNTKVYNFVRLSELYYAGSHGMDIKGPSNGHKHRKVSHGPMKYL